MVRRLAVADALFTEVLLVAAVVCAVGHVVARSDSGLIPATLIGGAALSAVAVLDVVAWRRLTLGLRSAALAGAGLPLLLFGSLMTIVADGGVRPGRDHGVVRWTGYAVGYLLLAAVATQVLLLVLSAIAQTQADTRPHHDAYARAWGVTAVSDEGVLSRRSRPVTSIALTVAASLLGVLMLTAGLSALSRGGALISLMFFGIAVVCAHGARLAWRR